MSAPPVLAIQARRLGDLILSFSLFARLRARYPQSPLWICAEPQFYRELAPFLPQARFFPPASLPELAKGEYAALINLSSRKDAASCAGAAKAPVKFGLEMDGQHMRARGFWQLYRLALTHNNRHNTFHWADLDRLDFDSSLPAAPLPVKKPAPAGKGIVGLFVGASEDAKRPDAFFWSRLARSLASQGFKPLLLGGKAEIPLGRQIAEHCGPGHVNLCGKYSLAQLAAAMQSLDLCISPDTGPMHLANLLGTPVLNLSMGNVSAAETGPASPGQWVLRAAMSCVGCWRCQRPKLYCKGLFNPQAVARLAGAIIKGEDDSSIAEARPPGLELLRTGRDALGLATLEPLAPNPLAASANMALDAFWRAAFLSFAFAGHEKGLAAEAAKLKREQPKISATLREQLGHMLAAFARACRLGQSLPENYWKRQPRYFSLYAGHAQMSLQNSDYSSQRWMRVMERTEKLRNALIACA